MDKRILLIIVLVIVIVSGIGAAFFLINRQQVSTAPTLSESPAITPVTTPSTFTGVQATLSTSAITPITTAAGGSIDVFLNTNGTEIDGFQFIATVTGNALATITDADTTADGVQIDVQSGAGFVASTNTVTTTDTEQTIRLGMTFDDTSAHFVSTTPTKVASIPLLAGSSGTITLTFDAQNSRIRLLSGQDIAMQVSSQTFPVSDALASSTTTQAVSTAAATLASTTQAATPTPSPTPLASTSPFCLATCFSDNDCAAGYVCEADRCVNPACPTSQTCSCSVTQAAATIRPTATPKITAAVTPKPTSTPIASSSATAADTPVTGAFEYTLLLVSAAFLFLSGGFYLSYRQETVSS